MDKEGDQHQGGVCQASSGPAECLGQGHAARDSHLYWIFHHGPFTAHNTVVVLADGAQHPQHRRRVLTNHKGMKAYGEVTILLYPD